MDAANVDLKAFTDDFYHRICGGHLEPVLDTLRYLKHETRVWFELTTLLIPGYNDSDSRDRRHDPLGCGASWGPMSPCTSPPSTRIGSCATRPPTPPATLTRARAIAQGNGVRYAYTGNVHDAEGGSTRCHHCGALLIERDWYRLGHWGLDAEGRCAACGTPCAGVFEARPGTWGSRRLPVEIRHVARH